MVDYVSIPQAIEISQSVKIYLNLQQIAQDLMLWQVSLIYKFERPIPMNIIVGYPKVQTLNTVFPGIVIQRAVLLLQ